MVSFISYAQTSLNGVLTNELFMGIVLGLLVQDIRNCRYLSWERKVQGEGIEKDFKRALLYLTSYTIAVPIGIMGLFIIIFFLWFISLIFG